MSDEITHSEPRETHDHALDPDSIDNKVSVGKLSRSWWEKLLWIAFCRDWRQLVIAAGTVLAVLVLKLYWEQTPQISPFEKSSELQSFLFGIGSILTLIASITFGFMIYSMQVVEGQKQALFSWLRNGVENARQTLAPHFSSGELSSEVSNKLHAFELIMPSDLPVDAEYWSRITKELFDEIEFRSPDLNEPIRTDILRRLVVALFLAEEAISSYGVNEVRQAVIAKIIARPVYKSFACLGAIMLLIISSAVYYASPVKEVYFLASIFLTVLSVAIIIEIVLYAKREADERLYGP